MSEPVDQSKVMVNGAAIALLTNMFNALREDLSHTEARLMSHMEDRFAAHDVLHEKDDNASGKEHSTLGSRIADLETWRHEQTMAQNVRDAKREGQIWLPMMVVALVSQHWRAIAIIAGMVGGAFVAGSSSIIGR